MLLFLNGRRGNYDRGRCDGGHSYTFMFDHPILQVNQTWHGHTRHLRLFMTSCISQRLGQLPGHNLGCVCAPRQYPAPTVRAHLHLGGSKGHGCVCPSGRTLIEPEPHGVRARARTGVEIHSFLLSALALQTEKQRVSSEQHVYPMSCTRAH